ncbi:hypothetical protein U1Q18_027692, partial [Sarracenia purpurea var. burkii]
AVHLEARFGIFGAYKTKWRSDFGLGRSDEVIGEEEDEVAKWELGQEEDEVAK